MDAASFIKRVDKLPSLPSIYYDLARAVESTTASLGDIAEVVRKDQSLASRLLKVANSAFYSFPSQITTIEEALQLIGLREMRDLALATCMIRSFPNLPSNLVTVESFWKHSIACGVFSSLIAERRRDSSPERLFIGGLLHDIGRLIIYLNAPKESETILARYQSDNLPLCTVESKVLGFDHTDAGAELLAQWRLPQGLVAAVRGHHAPAVFQGSVLDEATVHCADFLATALEFGDSGEPFVSSVSEEALKRCLIEENQLDSLISEAEARCNQLCAILETGSHA